MPFHNFASKLVMIIASLLLHHALLARGAPPGPFPSATAGTVQVNPESALSNASTADGAGRTTVAKSFTVDLLDKTKLPFLVECDAGPESKKLCELYDSLVKTVLIQRKPDPVTVDEVSKAIAEEAEANRFCDNLTPVLKNLKTKHPDAFGNNPLEKEIVCSRLCVEMNDDMTAAKGIKPICKVLLWGYKQELVTEQGLAAQDPVNKAGSVVVPPLLNENAPNVAVEKKDVEAKPTEPVAAQPSITIPEKTGQAPKNSEVNGAEDKKELVPKADAVAAAPSNVDVGNSQVSTSKAVTPSNIQEIPAQAEKGSPDEDDSQQDPELTNQNNIIAANADGNDGSIDNPLENENEEDYDDEFDQSSVGPKEGAVKGQPDQNMANGKDSDGFGVEQPAAAAAVQIERVDPFFDQDDSNFFSYFMFMMFACIACYVAYHNKSKLLALVVEGRRTSSGRGQFSKGRKHTAAYRKLDSNLEEAITSNASASSRSTSQIIY